MFWSRACLDLHLPLKTEQLEENFRKTFAEIRSWAMPLRAFWKVRTVMRKGGVLTCSGSLCLPLLGANLRRFLHRWELFSSRGFTRSLRSSFAPSTPSSKRRPTPQGLSGDGSRPFICVIINPSPRRYVSPVTLSCRCSARFKVSPVVTLAAFVSLFEVLDLALGYRAFHSLYPTR
jgi:hypothetical protein